MKPEPSDWDSWRRGLLASAASEMRVQNHGKWAATLQLRNHLLPAPAADDCLRLLPGTDVTTAGDDSSTSSVKSGSFA